MEIHYKTSNGHHRALVPWFLKKKKTHIGPPDHISCWKI